MFYRKWFLFGFILFLLLGCDPTRYTLRGNIVYNTNNEIKSVPKAKVFMECSYLRDKKGITDENGVFIFEGIGNIQYCNCKVYVEHPNFKNEMVLINPEHLTDQLGLFQPLFETTILLEEYKTIENNSHKIKGNNYTHNKKIQTTQKASGGFGF